MDTPKVLIVDPDLDSQQFYTEILSELGARIATTDSGVAALAVLAEETFDVVISEVELPTMHGLELLERAQSAQENLAVILTTAYGSVEDVVQAIQSGAADFLAKPFSADQLRLAVDKAARTHRLLAENKNLRAALDDRLKLDNMIAGDAQMQQVFKTVRAVASARTTVLITGESGTGKTLLARAIHQNSPRRDAPFVEVNCGALPENLLESELFGHVRGAFTGAIKARPGKFESAHGGTVFLDEIGTSSPGFQVKLLRVLQDRIVERIGDTKTIPVDVRIVLATNLDLEAAVAAGTFREDLYYRIQVVSVEMPPLRQRRSDISSLASHFLRRYAAETGKRIRGFSTLAMEALVCAPWPGNVRQLENVVERAVVLTENETIQESDLPPTLTRTATIDDDAGESLIAPDAYLRPLKDALEGPEKILIERALAHHQGNRKRTAESLGINRSTLFNKMRKFDLL